MKSSFQRRVAVAFMSSLVLMLLLLLHDASALQTSESAGTLSETRTPKESDETLIRNEEINHIHTPQNPRSVASLRAMSSFRRRGAKTAPDHPALVDTAPVTPKSRILHYRETAPRHYIHGWKGWYRPVSYSCRCPYPGEGVVGKHHRSFNTWTIRVTVVLPREHASCENIKYACPGDSVTGTLWKCPYSYYSYYSNRHESSSSSSWSRRSRSRSSSRGKGRSSRGKGGSRSWSGYSQSKGFKGSKGKRNLWRSYGQMPDQRWSKGGKKRPIYANGPRQEKRIVILPWNHEQCQEPVSVPGEPTPRPTRSPMGSPTTSPTMTPVIVETESPIESPFSPIVAPANSPIEAETSLPSAPPFAVPVETESPNDVAPFGEVVPTDETESPIAPVSGVAPATDTFPTMLPSLNESEAPIVAPAASPEAAPESIVTSVPSNEDLEPTISPDVSPESPVAAPAVSSEPIVTSVPSNEDLEPTVSPEVSPEESPTTESPTIAPSSDEDLIPSPTIAPSIDEEVPLDSPTIEPSDENLEPTSSPAIDPEESPTESPMTSFPSTSEDLDLPTIEPSIDDEEEPTVSRVPTIVPPSSPVAPFAPVGETATPFMEIDTATNVQDSIPLICDQEENVMADIVECHARNIDKCSSCSFLQLLAAADTCEALTEWYCELVCCNECRNQYVDALQCAEQINKLNGCSQECNIM